MSNRKSRPSSTPACPTSMISPRNFVMEKSLSGRGELLSIAYLVDYPHYLPSVAGWVFNEWGYHNPAKTVQDYEADFRSRLSRDAVPLTLIALRDGLLAGTASIF